MFNHWKWIKMNKRSFDQDDQDDDYMSDKFLNQAEGLVIK